MAFPNVVNDAEKNVGTVTTPINEEQIRDQVEALPSKSAAGSFPTTEAVKAAVSYAALVSQNVQNVDQMANTVLSKLMGYAGTDKRCSIVTCTPLSGGCNVFQTISPVGIVVSFGMGTLPGPFQNTVVVGTVTRE